jgi:hypothetical protein
MHERHQPNPTPGHAVVMGVILKSTSRKKPRRTARGGGYRRAADFALRQ